MGKKESPRKKEHSGAVLSLIEKLGKRVRPIVQMARRSGRAGMLFAEIRDEKENDESGPDLRTRIEQILYLAQNGEAEKYYDFGVIQLALMIRAWDQWEDLWRKRHPELKDDWELGGDRTLMHDWRRNVRQLLIEHHQEQVIEMDREVYIERLIEDGVDPNLSREVADFFYRAF